MSMDEDNASLNRLLDTALELPLHERERWLDALPDEHAFLKPRLKALLARAARIETSDFLHTLPKIGEAESSSAGEVIGPYRLLREIGIGGMGAVWLAERHDGALNRPVALKFLRTPGAHAAFSERLQRERDILAALVHPGIARLYDAGIGHNGLPYLALEYIEGQHIDEYCRSRQLDARTRVGLVLQIARAVAYAHGKLVVHRDLKPANVLVCADGQTHLLDFGIAKLMEDGRAVETRLTQVGGKALTPEYASPEQILGQPVTTASDVYSLGVILYELLTDSRPYTLKRESRGALEDAILDADPQRPSERVADSPRARALRGDLDAIVLKALKKPPHERYSTMDAFADDLSRFLDGRPVLARPDGSGYRFRKFVGRNRLVTASAAAVLFAVLAGASVAFWQGRVAVAEKERAEQVKDFIASIFAEANPFIGPQDNPTALELLARARERVASLSDLETETRLELMSVIAESFAGIGATAEAAQMVEPLVQRCIDELGESHPLTVRARSLRADVYRSQGKIKEMRSEIEAVLATLRPEANARPVEMVRALKAFGEADMDGAHYVDAEKTAQEALALMQKHRESWEPQAWESEQAGLWELIATAREALVDYGPALTAIERAFGHIQAAYRDRPRHPAITEMRFLFARIAAYVDMRQAIPMLEKSIADATEVFGPEHRTVGRYWQTLSVWQGRAGDLESAAASVEQALPILAKEYGQETLHVAAGLDAAGYVALTARQAQRAIDFYDRALGIATKQLPEHSEHLTVMRMRRALARAYLGQTQSSVAELRTIVDEFHERKFASPSRAYLALGEAERLAGDFRAALATQQAGLALIVEGPQADRERMSFFAEMGLDHLGLREATQAVTSLEQALALMEKQQTHVTPLRADALAGLRKARAALPASGNVSAETKN